MGSFWVAATDHRNEGQFQWWSDMSDVNVGTWKEGMPSGNRSKNCLIITSDGFWEEAECSESQYFLCETPFLQSLLTAEDDYTEPKQIGRSFEPEQLNIPISRRLTPIGGVGNKLYFVDDSLPEVSLSRNINKIPFFCAIV
jgi:hypothetical protein